MNSPTVRVYAEDEPTDERNGYLMAVTTTAGNVGTGNREWDDGNVLSIRGLTTVFTPAAVRSARSTM